ncbi:MAG: glycosyltransferase family 2 protein [Candidatus Woesearchaeota archaeon]
MKLSIIIPAYNEEKTISKVVDKVAKVNIGRTEKEIIIVDDFSKDSTKDVLDGINRKNVKIFYHRQNRGKGAAVRTGLKHATGDFVVIQDADMEYDPNDYPKLLEPLKEGRADAVYGSRFLEKHDARYKTYYLGNLMISLFASILFMKRVTDVETCYKMLRRDVVRKLDLKARRFDLEPEITAKLIKKGYRIIEVSIWYKCRSFDEGKKITWKDGVKALYSLLKYRFVD